MTLLLSMIAVLCAKYQKDSYTEKIAMAMQDYSSRQILY